MTVSTKVSQWRTIAVEDCMEAIIDYRGKSPTKTTFGVPLITAKIVKGGRIEKPEEFIAEADYEAWMRRGMPQSGDVVMTTEAPLGEIAQLDGQRVALAQRLITLRGRKGLLDSNYLKFAMQSAFVQEQLRSRATGTTVLGIRQSELRQVQLPIPPLSEQERIANILGSLDDKIELNRRINETLESMALRLFKTWFVDFDPVHAKAAVRRQHPTWANDRVSREALPKLDPKIASAFPDAFENSTLGKIPKGWRIAKLIEYTEAARGLSYKGSGLTDSGLPMHNLNSVNEGGGYKFEGMKYYAGEYKDRHLINAGEVIVANTEQGHQCLLLGYAAVVPASFGLQGLFSHHTYHLRIRDGSPLTPDFLCRLLNSPRMHDLVSGFGNGTTVNMLPIAGVEQPEFVLPDQTLIDAYSSLAADIRAREERFITENRDLANTRDRLLPQLLSGELRPPLSARKLRGGHE